MSQRVLRLRSKVTIIDPGFFATIQDMGRVGYRSHGVPRAGVMDALSAKIGNDLLGNDQSAAVMEFALVGPKLLFSAETVVAIAGAGIEVLVNEVEVPMYRCIELRAGDVLSFGKMYYGARGYLAVLGGFDVPLIMNSRSYYWPVTDSSSLKKGDVLKIFNGIEDHKKTFSETQIKYSHFNAKELAVCPGPEFEVFENKGLLFDKHFTIKSSSNRMAYQFEETLKSTSSEILTASIAPGMVQITPCGQLMALMRDAQVTGGYPRVLQLTEASIDRLAQKRAGDKVKFRLADRPHEEEL